MRVHITTDIVVTLVLSPAEAAWLHAAMQNPLQSGDPIPESQADTEMRRRFWEATKEGG